MVKARKNLIKMAFSEKLRLNDAIVYGMGSLTLDIHRSTNEGKIKLGKTESKLKRLQIRLCKRSEYDKNNIDIVCFFVRLF